MFIVHASHGRVEHSSQCAENYMPRATRGIVRLKRKVSVSMSDLSYLTRLFWDGMKCFFLVEGVRE